MGSLRTEVLSRQSSDVLLRKSTDVLSRPPSDLRAPMDMMSARAPGPSPSPPSNDDIEAIIQMATSARPSPDGRPGPPRDTRTQLFIGNLPYRVRWQDLKDLFRKAGTVLRADVSLGPDNRSRGYGTVLLATAEDAGRAVDMFNGYSWQTRILEVRPDRLPPDFEVAGGSVAATPVFAGSSPNLAAAAAVPGANPLMTLTGAGSGLTEDLDYASSVFSSERPASSSGFSGAGGRNLFVGNLPFHCQWQDLKDLFRQAGTIIRADVALGQDGRSRGFGTVVFANEVDADRAVKMFNAYEYNGRPLKVHYDKFSQTASSSGVSTTPASPNLRPSFQQPGFSALSSVHPTHIPMPTGYSFDFGAGSGPSSPFEVYTGHAHGVDSALSAAVATSLANLGAGPESPRTPSPRHHQQQQQQFHQQRQQQQQQQMQQQHQQYQQQLQQHQQQLQLQQQQQHQQQQQQQAVHGHGQHHPAHPGPISLPPPPSVVGFAMPPLSPHHMSPMHHPLMGSPLHHPGHHPMMTPHGLPPITPSMPPFTFLPQPSPHQHPSMPTPLTPTASINSPPVPHASHILSTFSPGVAMSPGAFWGRPGGGVNPFINPTVGAPVHNGFYAWQHSPQPSPHGGESEPAGYFPPVPDMGYFPPVSNGNGSIGASRLANEILRDGAERYAVDSSPSEATDGGAADSSTNTSWHTPETDEVEGVEERMEALRLKESARDAERDAGAVEESECDGDEHDPHPRAYSMSTSERPGEPPSMHRTGSDPAPPRPASNPQQTPQPQSADHDARRPLLSPAGEARKNLSLRLDALGR